MKTINTYIPLITPLEKNLTIDFLSLEKILYYIVGLEKIKNLIIFDKFSEYNNIRLSDKIDIINCITNNNKANLKIILKINNIYEYSSLISNINKKIYKNIYYIILDFPYFYNNKYKQDILNNYIKLFKYYKYLYFYFNISSINFSERFFLLLKSNCKNFIGLFDETNTVFKNYDLINSLEIIINNDKFLFNKIFLNTSGISSPLFYFCFNYLFRDVISIINSNKIITFNKIFYNLINFINIFYSKIHIVSGIKFLLNYYNLCNPYVKDPIYTVSNIKYYNQLIQLLNKIKNNENY